MNEYRLFLLIFFLLIKLALLFIMERVANLH